MRIERRLHSVFGLTLHPLPMYAPIQPGHNPRGKVRQKIEGGVPWVRIPALQPSCILPVKIRALCRCVADSAIIRSKNTNEDGVNVALPDKAAAKILILKNALYVLNLCKHTFWNSVISAHKNSTPARQATLKSIETFIERRSSLPDLSRKA